MFAIVTGAYIEIALGLIIAGYVTALLFRDTAGSLKQNPDFHCSTPAAGDMPAEP
ncbi:MAG: hypothetical protein WC379_05670 [Methanoregula sp.]|jgi:hypothetical protein